MFCFSIYSLHLDFSSCAYSPEGLQRQGQIIYLDTLAFLTVRFPTRQTTLAASTAHHAVAPYHTSAVLPRVFLTSSFQLVPTQPFFFMA